MCEFNSNSVSGTRLFWCNQYSSSNSHQIRSSTLTGGDKRTVLGLVPNCEGISWFGGDVYWADRTRRSIGVVDAETGEQDTLRFSVYNPRDVFVGDIASPGRFLFLFLSGKSTDC